MTCIKPTAYYDAILKNEPAVETEEVIEVWGKIILTFF